MTRIFTEVEQRVISGFFCLEAYQKCASLGYQIAGTAPFRDNLSAQFLKVKTPKKD
jgi:hypothetical protein